MTGNKCDCGYHFAEKDIAVMDDSPPEYYPYEGEVYTCVCPDCGCITAILGSEW